MSDRRFKVVLDDGVSTRVFAASGDTVSYKRNTSELSVPPKRTATLRWPKKTVTTHTLSWETVTYE